MAKTQEVKQEKKEAPPIVGKALELFKGVACDQLPVEISADAGMIVSDPQALDIPPRVKLLQGLSPEIQEGIPGAKAGLFFFTGTQKVLSDKINVMPIIMRQEWIESDLEGNVIFQTTDALKAMGQWGEDKFRWECFNTLVWIREVKALAFMTFRKTSKRVGYTFFNTAKQRPPLCHSVFELHSELKPRQNQPSVKYGVVKARFVGDSTKEELEVAREALARHMAQMSRYTAPVETEDQVEPDEKTPY